MYEHYQYLYKVFILTVCLLHVYPLLLMIILMMSILSLNCNSEVFHMLFRELNAFYFMIKLSSVSSRASSVGAGKSRTNLILTAS